MVSERHMMMDLLSDRHYSGLNHTGHLAKHHHRSAHNHHHPAVFGTGSAPRPLNLEPLPIKVEQAVVAVTAVANLV